MSCCCCCCCWNYVERWFLFLCIITPFPLPFYIFLCKAFRAFKDLHWRINRYYYYWHCELAVTAQYMWLIGIFELSSWQWLLLSSSFLRWGWVVSDFHTKWETGVWCARRNKSIWVILLKTGQNCDIEGKNSKCEFFNAIIWKWKLDISCVHKYKT